MNPTPSSYIYRALDKGPMVPEALKSRRPHGMPSDAYDAALLALLLDGRVCVARGAGRLPTTLRLAEDIR